MAQDSNADEMLQALSKEVVKSKSVYDGSDRLITRYEAFANAENGQPCLKTDYTYVGITTKVDASKESLAVWDASWDF
jgi:hypothetical protein